MDNETNKTAGGGSEDSILERARTQAETAAPPQDPPKEEDTQTTESTETTETTELEPNLEERPQLPEKAFQAYAQAQVLGADGKPVPLFKAFPELRGVIGRHEAMSELGQFGLLKSLAERFPSEDDLFGVTEQLDAWQALQEKLKESPRDFVQSLRELDDHAVQKLLSELPAIEYELNPDAYAQKASRTVQTALANARALAQKSKDEEVVKAIDLLAQQVFGFGGYGANLSTTDQSGKSPRELELEKKLKDRDAQESEAKLAEFHETVKSKYVELGLKEIEDRVKRALPTATEGQLKRIVQESWAKLEKLLDAQPQVRSRVQDVYKQAARGRAGEREQTALVKFLEQRLKAGAPGVVREVLSAWTKEVLAANAQALKDKKDVADKTKETSTSTTKVEETTTKEAPKGPNWMPRKRSEDEIFADLGAQR